MAFGWFMSNISRGSFMRMSPLLDSWLVVIGVYLQIDSWPGLGNLIYHVRDALRLCDKS